MAWIKVAVLLVGAVCLSSALLPDWETLSSSTNMELFLNTYKDKINADITLYHKTGERTALLNEWAKFAKFTKEMAIQEIEEYTPEQKVLTCAACRIYADRIIRLRQGGAQETELVNEVTSICGIVTDFTPHVCRETVAKNFEPMVFIIDARPNLSGAQVCGFVLQGECGANPDPMFDFTINVPSGPAITGPKTVTAPRNPNELRIVHITDLHLDLNYMVGGIATCPNPICCRRRDGPASNPADAAGRWGDYRDCGTPVEVLRNSLEQIRRQHPQIDMIYHTGDMIDHGVWETTRETNIQTMDTIYNMLREIFGNVPVYSAMGNHEANPTNVFAPSTITRPTLSMSWLYNYKADVYQRHQWLPAAALATIRRGGFYTHLIATGFRLISLNNNDCYTFNWWTMYTRDEIVFQMQWLQTTLHAAELAGERVHILAHMSPGSGACYKWYARQYRRVIDRYHPIIGGQFNGHSHRDQFQIVYDSPSSSHAVNVAWNAGSIVPFSFLNPNYHYMFVDRTHYQVQDYESWIYHIDQANQNQATPPVWIRQYTFREAFGLTDTSPAAMDRFVNEMVRNRNTMRQYWTYTVKGAAPRLAGGCDDNCLRGQMCGLVTNEFNEPRRCNALLANFGTVA